MSSRRPPASRRAASAAPGPVPRPALAALAIAADPDAWAAAGFDVAGGRCRIGRVDFDLAGSGAGEGLLGWSFRGAAVAGDIDGISTRTTVGPAPAPAPVHPNTAAVLDHVVAVTPDFDRTVAAAQRAGLPLRRIREAGGDQPVRQGFLLMGDCILEVAGPMPAPGDGPAALWGLVVVVADLAAAAQCLGTALGRPRDAVQPGRQIATVRPEAGLGTAVALMTPRPGRTPTPVML